MVSGLWFGLGEVGRCREGGFARTWPDRRRAPAHGGLSPMRFRLAEDASTFGRSSGPVEQICVQCAQGKVMKAGGSFSAPFPANPADAIVAVVTVESSGSGWMGCLSTLSGRPMVTPTGKAAAARPMPHRTRPAGRGEAVRFFALSDIPQRSRSGAP